MNNYGFDIERTSPRPTPYQGEGGEAGRGWEKIGFVKGAGNSNSPKSYSFVDNNPNRGSEFQYRLKQIDNDGGYKYSAIVEAKVLPTKYELYQNYPNPFNPTTIIKFFIPNVETGHAPSLQLVTLKFYDVLGREVLTLVNEQMSAGYHQVEFNASNLASGIYFYRITAGGSTGSPTDFSGQRSLCC